MRLLRHYQDLTPADQGRAVAIGNFDGLHLGHRAVLAAAAAIAPPAVLSFEPHPRSFFRPEAPVPRLTPWRIKARLLAEAGVGLALFQRFDADFAAMPAGAFIEKVLVAGLAPRAIVVGSDFRFGQGRAGDVALLQQAGAAHGFSVLAAPLVAGPDGSPVKSSQLRALVAAGDMAGAASLLGRPFEIEGRVIHGDKRGRELGWPTANMELGEFIHPAFGIYAVRAAIDDGPAPAWRDGVANLGIRPMFALPAPLMEVHLLDWSGDLYGRHLRVQLVERLRGEAKFDSLPALVAQIEKDAAAAKMALSSSVDGG